MRLPASRSVADSAPPFVRKGILSMAILGILLVSLALPASAANSVPFLNSLVPSATAPGGPAFTLTVTGAGFVSGAVVNWNGSPRTTTFVSVDQLTASITAADIASAATAVVTVTNPAPAGGTSNGQYLQIANALTPPNFTSLSSYEIDDFRARQSNILLRDFNGDGKLDLVGYANGDIYFLKGDGDGSFSGGWIPSVGPPLASSDPTTFLSTADLNGDGKPDLVICNSNGVFSALGNGDGTFTLLSPQTLTPCYQTPVIADFNGDGFLDIAYTSPNFFLQVLLGNGDGTFRTGFSLVPTSAQVYTGVLGAGDFNGDGKLDLLVSTASAVAGVFPVLEFPGNGDGTFGTPSTALPSGMAGEAGNAVVGDFNGDGKLDFAYFVLVAPGFGSGSFLSVSLGNGDGTFRVPYQTSPSTALFTAQTGTLPLLGGDFNGDGKLDLAVGNQLFYGNGDGTFAPVGTPQSGLQMIQAGDVNGDGKLDLLAFGTDPSNSSLQDIRTLIQVPGPADFGGGFAQLTQTVVPGNSVNYSGSVTSINGFAGTVSLSASGLPTGVTAMFSPATIAGGSGSYTLTLSAAGSVPLGNYTITVTGTSGTVSHSSSITLVVNSSLGDFAVSIAPGSDAFLNVNCGQSGVYVFQVTPINGYTGDVTFSIEAAGPLAPPNTATFNPVTVHGASGTTTLTVNTVANCFNSTSGSLILSATSGPIVHQGDVFLGVSNGPGDFTGSTTPSSQTITVGQSATFTVNVTGVNGFFDDVLLNVSGVPPGAKTLWSATSFPLPGSATLTISAPPGTPPGTYPLLVMAFTSGRSRGTYVALTINAP